jgi:hypothetical protein
MRKVAAERGTGIAVPPRPIAVAAAMSCGRGASPDANFADGDPDGVVRTFAAALMFWPSVLWQAHVGDCPILVVSRF